MMTDEISEFLEKIDSEHFNCVYSCNGMTLMRTEEYSNRLEEITELKREVNKHKQHEKYFKNNIKINQTQIFRPDRDPLHPDVRKTYIISKNGCHLSYPDHDTMYIMAPEGRIIPEQYTAFVMVYVTGKSISRSMLGYLYLIEKEDDIPYTLSVLNVVYATYGDNENELEIFSWDEEISAYKHIGYLEVKNG